MSSATLLSPDAPATPGTSSRSSWLMLATLLGGQLMALLDVTIVNVAMGSISRDLGASGTTLQLVVSGYTVSYAVLLITCARLGATYGPRRVFRFGVATFTLSSLACGLAPAVGVLIVARLVQGAGAALMMPQIMSVIQTRFTGAERAKALGAYSSVIATGSALGLVVGGLLVNANVFSLDWRPVFLVNVPIGALVWFLVPRLVPFDTVRAGRSLDLAGLAVAVPAVVAIVVPLVIGREQGWPAWAFATMAAGVAMLGLFVAVEQKVARRGGDPLLDFDVLRAPGLATGVLALGTLMASFGGFLFSLSLHLQTGLGDSALRTGLTFAPMSASFGLLGYFWRRLPAAAHGWMTPAGMTGAAASYIVIGSFLSGGDSGGWMLFLTLALGGAALGAAFGPLMNNTLLHVPFSRAADASGVLTTVIQLSQVIGIAAFGTLFLSDAEGGGAAVSGDAIATTLLAISAVTVAGSAVSLALTRTVHRARREAALATA